MEFLNFLAEHWISGIGISAILIGILLRVIPTEKNRDIIKLIFQILDLIIPNLKKGGGKHTLIIAFFLLSFASYSQTIGTFKGIRLVNLYDTTLMTPVGGSIYYNLYDSTLRGYDTAWFNLRQSGGGGGLTTASNGLTAVGTDVRLGGTLSAGTTLIDNGGVLGTHTLFTSGALGIRASNGINRNQFLSQSTANSFWTINTNESANFMGSIGSIVNAGVPFESEFLAGVFAQDAGFTFTTTGDVLTVGSLTALTTATLPAINLGGNAADPSTLTNGSLWYNTTGNDLLKYRKNAATHNIISAAATTTANRIPFFSDNAVLTDDAQFTFNTTGDVVTGGRFVGSTTTTLAAVNLGTFAGDPSGIIDGDLWYNSTLGTIRGRNNGVTVSIGGGGSGDMILASVQTSTGKKTFQPSATTAGLNTGTLAGDPSVPVDGDVWFNTAAGTFYGYGDGQTMNLHTPPGGANNEMQRNNAGQFGTTGIFVTTSGNMEMGTGAVGGTRTIAADGSAANVGLTLNAKAAGRVTLGGNDVQFTFDSGNGMNFTDNILQFSNSTALATQTIAAGKFGTAGNDLELRAANSSGSGVGGDLRLIAGDALAGNNDGGEIFLEAGRAAGTGIDGDIILETNNLTGTLKLNDGANEQMGTATLVAGTVTVNNSKVTANSRIFLTTQTLGGTIGVQYISARTAGTSFTITSSSGTDTSTVAWLIVEPN